MTLWLTRTGRHGEHEQKFFSDMKIYVCWQNLNHDLSTVNDQAELREVLSNFNPNAKSGRLKNHASQIWPFAKSMKIGDWVVIPYKTKPAINIGEITGDYTYHPDAENPYYHSRTFKWIAQDIPRSNFDQDLLYSIGAFMTICRIERNDAEARIRQMATNNWKSVTLVPPSLNSDDADADESSIQSIDLEQLARDQISKWIIAKFQGHGLARLVDAILRAQGYETHVSPAGPDKGVDILASGGPLGFGQPRICVQVKSSDTPVDLPTLNQLIGTMQNVQADQGLFVSWGGFKSSIDREIPSNFFRVRLWNQDDLIDEILKHYDELDDEIKAELPLKRIWTVSEVDDA